MPDPLEGLQSGSVSLRLFIPTALLLGALHALEPGHSKTMMTAFRVAIRGTLWQAVLLGLSAALSHSLVLWLLAALALKAGESWNAAVWESYPQAVSGLCMLGLSVWLFFRTRKGPHAAHDHHHVNETTPGTAAAAEFQDAHQRQHALEIEQRFAGHSVSTPQIILFEIAGSLMPCPAALSAGLAPVMVATMAA